MTWKPTSKWLEPNLRSKDTVVVKAGCDLNEGDPVILKGFAEDPDGVDHMVLWRLTQYVLERENRR